MSDMIDALICDLLAFVAHEDRPYEDVIEAWRTSCPRLPVWEDANERGLIARDFAGGRGVVRITPAGEALLRQRGA